MFVENCSKKDVKGAYANHANVKNLHTRPAQSSVAFKYFCTLELILSMNTINTFNF